MRLLITGICGFVGSTLAKAIAADGCAAEIVGIDNLSRAGSEVNRRPLQALGVRVVPGDIRNPSDMENLSAADWVIDAAASPSVLAGVDGRTSSRQLVEHNLGGTINLLEYCKRHQAGLVLLSTSRVYSIDPLVRLGMRVVDDAFQLNPDQRLPAGISARGVSEEFSTAPPVSLYGSTKVASEHLALEYGETFQFPVWVNRCGVMAGAGQFGHPAQGIFAYWIHSFFERSPLKYIGFGGTGHQTRDCLHPRDLVPLLKSQWAEPTRTQKPRTANVSGGVASAMSLKQLSTWCESRVGSGRVDASDEVRPFDVPWLVLNPTLAKETWGWSPMTHTTQILEEIAAHAVANPTWLSLSR